MATIPRALLPLRQRPYRRLFGALVASLLGAGLLLVGLVWQVVALGGGPSQLSFVASASAVGMLVTTLLGGALADRVPQKRLLLGVEVLQRRVPPAMLGRVSSLDFFVSLAFMPVSMALAGPVSELVGLRTTFLAAGLVPTLLAVAAVLVARMPADELAHPLDTPPADRDWSDSGSAEATSVTSVLSVPSRL